MSWLLTYTPACSPDAGVTELPTNPVDSPPQQIHRRTESAPLLGGEHDGLHVCEVCSRIKGRNSVDAYPTMTIPFPKYELAPRRRPRERGCKRFLVELKHLAFCCCSRQRYQLLTRYRYSKQKKPYSAISVHIEQLTSESYEEDDLAGVPDLLEVVKLQATGSTEVARAIRKKLKYGSVHRQLRALTILDGLLQNGGQRLQRAILSDAPLQERLRIAAIDPLSDQDVQAKCKQLFASWVSSVKEQPGLEGARSLYNQLPKKRQVQPQEQRRLQSRVLRETEEAAQRDEDDDPFETRPRAGSVAAEPSSPQMSRKSSNAVPISLTSASTFGTNKVKKDKKDKKKAKLFNLEKEKPAILQSIAASSVASSNLNNALKLVNREHKRISEDAEVQKRFDTCKNLRRNILRYIQFVETEELLGGLIDANERLVVSLMAYEVMDKSIDDDSDSELEEAAHLSRQDKRRQDADLRDAQKKIAEMELKSPPKPPRPSGLAMPPRPKAPPADETDSEESEDDDDPFADRNATKTPDPNHRQGFSWREV